MIWHPYTPTQNYSNYNLFIMLGDWIPSENTMLPLSTALQTTMIVQIQRNSIILQNGANNTIYCSTSAKPSCWLWILEKEGGIDTSPVFNSGAGVEQVNSFRFQGINITEDVSWSSHITTLGKKSTKKALLLMELIIYSLVSWSTKHVWSFTAKQHYSNLINNWGRCGLCALLKKAQ